MPLALPGRVRRPRPLAEGVLGKLRERILKRRNLIRRDARAVDLRPLWRLERGPLRRGVCARARPRALSLAGGVARLDDEVGVTRATRGTDSGAATAERNDTARHGVADKRCGSTDRERQRRHHQTMARREERQKPKSNLAVGASLDAELEAAWASRRSERGGHDGAETARSFHGRGVRRSLGARGVSSHWGVLDAEGCLTLPPVRVR